MNVFEQAVEANRYWNDYWHGYGEDARRVATHEVTRDRALALLEREPACAPGARILDLGCGDGALTSLLAARLPGRLAGADVSALALRKAMARTPRRAPYLRTNAYVLPFADARFDAVVSFGYASVASYVGLQREIARVLKPGGVLICDFQSLGLYAVLRPRRTLDAWRRFRRGEPKMAHWHVSGVRQSFAAAGLQLEATVPALHFPPLRGSFWPKAFFLGFERAATAARLGWMSRIFLARFRRGT